MATRQITAVWPLELFSHVRSYLPGNRSFDESRLNIVRVVECPGMGQGVTHATQTAPEQLQCFRILHT